MSKWWLEKRNRLNGQRLDTLANTHITSWEKKQKKEETTFLNTCSIVSACTFSSHFWYCSLTHYCCLLWLRDAWEISFEMLLKIPIDALKMWSFFHLVFSFLSSSKLMDVWELIIIIGVWSIRMPDGKMPPHIVPYRYEFVKSAFVIKLPIKSTHTCLCSPLKM